MDQDFAEGLEVHPTSDEKSRALGEESEMATDLSSGPFEGRGLITSEFLTPVAEAPPADEDDDVLFVEPLAKTSVSVAVPGTTTSSSTSMAPVDNLNQPEVDKLQTTVKDLSPPLDALAETIIIDDEEDAESGTVLPEKSVSPVLNKDSDLDPSKVEDTSSSSNKVLASSHSHIDTPVTHSTISTEPDSEIRIANVTTLDDGDTTLRNSSREPVHQSHSNEGAMDMNLMITSVTSLQSNSLGEVTNGPQISSAFSLIPEVQTAPTASNSDSSRQGTQSGAGTFNPGRMNAAGEVVQNGELRSHQRSDSWISQSASFPRNQKQPGVDSMSPVASLPKSVFPPPASQQPTKPVKVTCANCTKPLRKGQTAYQRKGSVHLFCSTTCLSAFSHKPAPKKNCTMCKKDITSMKGTIVAQVDSSESFQEFCSTTCLSSYENKQVLPKSTVKTRCTVCGKLTEIRHEVSFKNVTHKICSDHCFNRYRMANGLIMNCCEQCGEYLPTRSSANHFLIIDGQHKRFCCENCVKDYKQSISVQSSTNGQTTRTPSGVQLKCNYCKTSFSLKPETLEWENKVYQFCSKTCCEDYKKLHCIVTYCEYCQEEKTLHETVKFSGVKKPFCSEGCKLLFKQEFARRLGLKCVSCNYCSQMCKRGATKEIDGVVRDFCSEACSRKFTDWYYKAARCDCCKIQGNLTETVQWRAEIKHFCDQQCLLRFYCQQNEPNMSTQKGPENLCFGQGTQTLSKAGNQNLSHSTSPVKDVKNKAVLCKPLSMTKATYCKPHMQTKACQTEPEVKTEYVPIPVPVPVYVPVPVHLYSQSTPVPLTVPVPVPVPVFVPTTLDSAEKIVQTIDELKNKIPSNPLEADILAMAEVIAEADEKIDSDVTNHSPKSHGEGGVEDIKLSSPGDFCEPDLDLEMDFPKAVPPSTSEEIRNSEITLPPALCAEIEEKPHPQVKKKGSKRRAILSNGPQADNPDTSQNLFTLKSSYGVNAWKRWVLMTDSKEEQENTKSVRLKGDLLKHTAAELNYALSRFVCDIRRPNGESYEPDSIYYLCLAIQQHLCENGRKDNIFCDTYYQMFIQELNKILKGWKPSILPDGSVFSRIQEHHMWSSKMIGDHSPTVLLNTLVYFNTKYFGLRTVEQHLQLSFANVFKQLKNARTKERTVCIQFPSITEDKSEQTGNRKRKGRDDENDPDYEPEDMSSGNGSRCPIKDHDRHIYELYFSKCPESLKQRVDMFYVTPEISTCADSPLWYTTSSLDRSTLERMLTRVLLIKDLYSERDYSDMGEND
ncbi:ZMYM2 protein, partial [Polypterus senegalus]|nr:zinc finger MYM-type protein 2 isoform X1 [Polypterus senegalus]MBN3294533.1 ZMYM2 protein [Polypterus senegalus]